jgi:DNA-binding response OmpR family regulator
MCPYRILIVEDQREVSRLLRSALETLEHDFDVIELPSAEEALLESSRNKVDLLVSDFRLPGMTGIELLRKVRKNHPLVKIILITGQTDPKIRKDVAEAGADAFFIKPVPITDFLDAVERQLGLVETIHPPQPITIDDHGTKLSLSDLLAGMRKEMGAIAVLLLNDTGQVLAHAGEFPEGEKETALISCLLVINKDGEKVARIIGQKAPWNWHVYGGGKYDLIFATVGKANAIVVVGDGLANEEQVLKTVYVFSLARKYIEQIFGEPVSEIPVEPEKTTTAPVEVDEQAKSEIEPLIEEAKNKLKFSDVNEFWNNAAHDHKPPSRPDTLSYEQAKQLGLAPEDKS